jgi:hemolysin D
MSKRKTNISRRDDQEFLPAALEIIETPPSPIRMAIIIFFAAFVVVALTWTYFGRFDIVAIAQGKFQPPGRVKVVQPVETAKVQRIAVTNGTKVKKGDVLIAFEDQDALADLETIKLATLALEAEIMRRSVGIDFIAERKPDNQFTLTDITWPLTIPEVIQKREESVIRADIAQLHTSLMAKEAEINLKNSEKNSLGELIAAQENILSNLHERVEMRLSLTKTGSASRASLIDGKEVLLKESALLTGYRGNYVEAEASLKVLSSERERLIQAFLTEYTQKMADADKAREELIQRLIKAQTRLNHMTLKSPADGFVQASMIFTVGQVVTPAQEIMRIVPEGKTLEIEAYLPNKDVGFVKIGQDVAVKIESFPWTRYGILAGKISHVAQDAVPMADASGIEGNTARAIESQTFSGAQRVQNLVFPITVSIENNEIIVDGSNITVTPGMAATVEIKTGSRRIMEYLFSPLFEVSNEAMRER